MNLFKEIIQISDVNQLLTEHPEYYPVEIPADIYSNFKELGPERIANFQGAQTYIKEPIRRYSDNEYLKERLCEIHPHIRQFYYVLCIFESKEEYALYIKKLKEAYQNMIEVIRINSLKNSYVPEEKSVLDYLLDTVFWYRTEGAYQFIIDLISHYNQECKEYLKNNPDIPNKDYLEKEVIEKADFIVKYFKIIPEI